MVEIFQRSDWSIDHEIIIRFNNGKFDWIDPISSVSENDESLVVENSSGNIYEYKLSDIDKYKIRIYSPDDIYNVN